MTYLALYRRWRPKKFLDIVGQDHISKTLRNALLQDRIAHAYLFCGPRGTGKTSSAKVFAKSVNCLNLKDGEPCNECSNCEKINNGSSLDVFEIDAASNRGVDEIRDLRERVKFAPTEGSYKIYIIDEVHMLTTEAFNALLKTLEEPPDNIIFILATTEPHKIPLTILSRCQRFDFRPIGMDKILERLTYIIKESAVEVEEDGLKLISKAAEGGMRDALSILDQCISLGGAKVTVDDVNSILGTVNEETLYSLINSILTKDVDKSLQYVDLVVKEGKNLQQFIKDLISGFRNLLVLTINSDRDDLIIASKELLQKVKHMARETSKNSLMQIIDLLTDIEREMKWTNQPRLMMEIAIVKSCSIKDQVDIGGLLDKIEELEFNLNKLKESGIQIETRKITVPQNTSRLSSKEESKVELKNCEEDKLNRVKELWPKILDILKKKDKMQIQAFLIEGEPIHFNNQILFVAFEHSFHKEQVEIAKNKGIIEEIISKTLKESIALRCLLKEQIISGKGESQESEENSLVDDAQSFFGQDVKIKIKN